MCFRKKDAVALKCYRHASFLKVVCVNKPLLQQTNVKFVSVFRIFGCQQTTFLSRIRAHSCTLTYIGVHTMHNCGHYTDVIMGAIASQNTSFTIVYSTVYSDADQRKHQSSASLAFVRGIHRGTGEFPAQMSSNAENVSI